jgi:hypothetical protein
LYFGEEAMTFNHDYTFTVFVYSIIFLLWYLYATQSNGPLAKGSGSEIKSLT